MKYELAITSWGEEEKEAAKVVIDSGFTTMGKQVREYECLFASYFHSKYCVMVNSGSSANLLAVAALFYTKNNPLKIGDEVIVPAVSWATTYYPLAQYGLRLKFVDIDLDTLNFDLGALQRAITNKTKMIMAVNLLGNSNDYKKIEEMISDRNIMLIEDNCEALGATFNEKFTGTFGRMGTFSSFFSHHISTMEGGMILTDEEELYQILISIRSHGWTRLLPKRNLVCSEKSDNLFDEQFRFILPGYNVRPLEIMGAIGKEQLKKVNNFNAYRRLNAKYFKEKFSASKYFITQKEIGSSSWFGFSFILKENALFTRKELLEYLSAKDIETRPIVAGNFTKNEVLKFFDYELAGEMKNADYLDKHGFFVGNHQFDIKDKIDYLYTIIEEFIEFKQK
nr:DegT/DnrJ/EryC1/StrS family aminotransferase [Treponema socranskii]